MWCVGITVTSGSIDEYVGDTLPSGYAIYSWYFSTFDDEAELIGTSPSQSPSYETNNSSMESMSFNRNNYAHPLVSKKGHFGLILGISFALLFLMIIMGFTIIVGCPRWLPHVHHIVHISPASICGRRVLDFSLSPEKMNLLDWVWTLHMNDNLMDSVDPGMLQCDAHGIHDEFEKVMMMWRGVIHVALNCCHPEAECRLTMRDVRHILIEGHLLPLPVSRRDRSILNHGPLHTLESTSNAPTLESNSSSFSMSL